MNIDPVAIGEEACVCGRSKERTHCPLCGKANFYALKKRIERPHPMTGIMTSCTVYRCRGCNGNFDELEWHYNCKAPVALHVHQRIKTEMTMEQWRKRAMSGEKFDENMRRAFLKAVKVPYFDFMQIIKVAETVRIKHELKELAQAKPQPVVISNNTKPQNAYHAHLEQCQTCMIADNREQHCDAGKILFDLNLKGELA